MNKKLQKEFFYQVGSKRIPMSNNLMLEEKLFLKAVSESNEYTRISMLTEKIIILSKRIKQLNFWTSIFSVILIIFAFIQVIIMLYK